MNALSPLLLIAAGVVVLLFGRRLAILGLAIGALLGISLVQLFGMTNQWASLLTLLVLAIGGFFLGRMAKRFDEIIVMVFGALGGAAIVLAGFDLFNYQTVGLKALVAAIGAAVGLILARRFKWWALAILSGLVGGLLIVRGLIAWMPSLDGTIGSLLVLALAGGGTWYQGRELRERREERKAEATPAAPPPAVAAPTVAAAPTPAAPPPAPPAATAPPAAPPAASGSSTPPSSGNQSSFG